MKSYDSICCFSKERSLKKRLLWEITTICNLSCEFCHRSRDFNYGPSLDEIKAVSKVLKELEISSIIISGGEPLLRKDIFEIIEYLNNENFEIDLCTNATLIDYDTAYRLSKVLKEISLSIDSFDTKIHDQLRGEEGALEQKLKGVQNLINNGIEIHSISLLNEDNLEDIENMVKFLKDIGIKSISFIGEIPIGAKYNFFVKDEVQVMLAKKFDYIREKYRDISINTKEIFKNKGYCECRAGKNIFALDVNLNLRPCMLRRDYSGLNIRNYLQNKDILSGKDIIEGMLKSKTNIIPQEGICPGARIMTSEMLKNK